MSHRTVGKIISWEDYAILKDYFFNETHLSPSLRWTWLWEDSINTNYLKITGLTWDDFGECVVDVFDMKELS